MQGIRLRQRMVQMFPSTLQAAYDSYYTLIDAACSATARARTGPYSGWPARCSPEANARRSPPTETPPRSPDAPRYSARLPRRRASPTSTQAHSTGTRLWSSPSGWTGQAAGEADVHTAYAIPLCLALHGCNYA